jgi:hypothetical protein
LSTTFLKIAQIFVDFFILYIIPLFQAHIVGGFSGSFSSKDVCRFCHCKHDDLAEHIHNFDGEDAHKPWTVEEYNKIAEHLPKNQVEDCGHTQVTGLNLFDEYEEPDDDPDDDLDEESDEESEGEDSEVEETDNYGVKRECVFNKLRTFHCVTSMPPDCLHDLFEGVLAQDLLGIIRILKIKGWFSCEDYNLALKRFPLSAQEASNKPQPVPLRNSVKKLSGKAVSIWCIDVSYLYFL